MDRKLLIQLVSLYIITHLLGIYTALTLIRYNVKAEFISNNPNDPINSIAIITYIIFVTGLMLLAIYFFKKYIYYIFKILEVLAVFGTSLIVLSAFPIPAILVFVLLFFLLGIRIFFPENIIFRNIASIVSTAGVGSLLGVSLGPLSVLVFIIFLSIYDFIAVFKTKHMVTLAKNISKKNLSFTFAMPTKKHQFELGTGDIVIPLTFTVSVLNATTLNTMPLMIVPAILIMTAALIGLILTLEYVSKKAGTALPALPPQTIIMAITFTILYLLRWVAI